MSDSRQRGRYGRPDPRQTNPTEKIDGSVPYDPVEVGEKLVTTCNNNRVAFSTSQLRKVLTGAVIIKNKIEREVSENDTMSPANAKEIRYLRLKLVYQMGRSNDVKNAFSNNGIDMPAIIKNIGNSKQKFDDFYRLLESIVAFKKYAGDK